MKVKAKIWYPVWEKHEEEIDLDIPDGYKSDDWIYDHSVIILSQHGADEYEVGNALDLGYAGIEIIEEKQ